MSHQRISKGTWTHPSKDEETKLDTVESFVETIDHPVWYGTNYFKLRVKKFKQRNRKQELGSPISNKECEQYRHKKSKQIRQNHQLIHIDQLLRSIIYEE